MPRERCGAPFVAFTGLRELPDAPYRRILAMQPSPSGESRLRSPEGRVSVLVVGNAVVDMIARRLFDEVEVDELFAAGVYRTPIE